MSQLQQSRGRYGEGLGDSQDSLTDEQPIASKPNRSIPGNRRQQPPQSFEALDSSPQNPAVAVPAARGTGNERLYEGAPRR